jgi:hypothetical protein
VSWITTIINNNSWRFYRDTITKMKDFSKIVLDIDEVNTIKETISCDQDKLKVNLLAEKETTLNGREVENSINTKSHGWLNQRVVKGTVAIDKGVFNPQAVPVEVPFENGASEFGTIIRIEKEAISFSTIDGENIYSYELKSINDLQRISGSPSFSPVRTTKNLLSTSNVFIKQLENMPNSWSEMLNGDWYYDEENNIDYPFYKDTTLSNTQKWEIHLYGVEKYKEREDKREERLAKINCGYRSVSPNFNNNNYYSPSYYYYPGYISPYILYPTLRYNYYFSPRFF